MPDRSVRRLYLENLYGDLAPFQLLSRDDYEPGKQFVAETEDGVGLGLPQIAGIQPGSEIEHHDYGFFSALRRTVRYGPPYDLTNPDILLGLFTATRRPWRHSGTL